MFALYLLSVNIEAQVSHCKSLLNVILILVLFQQNVFNELEEIFKDDFYRALNYQDLQSMTYLEMVIKETLRLYPSVPFFGRNLQEDLEFGNYKQYCPLEYLIVYKFCLFQMVEFFQKVVH